MIIKKKLMKTVEYRGRRHPETVSGVLLLFCLHTFNRRVHHHVCLYGEVLTVVYHDNIQRIRYYVFIYI